jgi:tetratricopeptide (TPR) repeat protein
VRKPVRAVLLIATGAVALWVTGCSKLKARDELNKGVQSYRIANYEQAIGHFQEAANLDPSLSVAKLYLATAYAQQFTPGITTDANMKVGQEAVDVFKQVLQGDGANIPSLKGIASIYFNMKKFPEAKDFQKQVIQLDPKDPEAHYSVGVIDWALAYPERMKVRNGLGLKPEQPIADKKACARLQAENGDIVKEGIDYLNQAMDLRKDYDDAMAYLNLMYREKADLECSDPQARAADLKTADDFVKQAMDTKKAKAEKAAQGPGGIVLDQNK